MLTPALRSTPEPEWRNWQTRGTQNPVSLGTCGFDPHLRHRRQAWALSCSLAVSDLFLGVMTWRITRALMFVLACLGAAALIFYIVLLWIP